MKLCIRFNNVRFLLLIFMLALFSYESVSQYNINASVLGGGGGVIEGNGFRVVSTLGQTFVGSTVSTGLRLHTGIWHQYDIVTSVQRVTDERPSEYRLEQNYPNPFNPSTTIGFALKEQSDVVLVVYNVLGQKVLELVNEELSAGRYEIYFDAGSLPSGIYIYRITAGNYAAVKRMILLK